MKALLVFLQEEKVVTMLQIQKKYEENMSHLKKEIEDFLQSWKNLYILLSKKETYMLASAVTSPRKWQNSYSTYTKNNYEFLSQNIGKIVSASGKQIEFSGNAILSDFYNKFKENLEYQLYLKSK